MKMLAGWVGATALPKIGGSNQGSEGGNILDRLCAVRFHGPLFDVGAVGAGAQGFQDGDVAVVITGRPHWRDSSATADRNGIARSVLTQYRRTGVDMLQHLGGTFALALTADAGRTALLAIDRMGIGTITYRPAEHGLIFGTSADVVNSLLDGSPREIELQSIFNYMFLHMVPGPATIYRDQFRIPPGGFVQLKDRLITTGRYWQPKYDERPTANLRDLKDEFRSLLERSVEAALDGRPTGAFLSGGTDSSTITGLLAKVSGKPARTYSIGFKEKGYDEIEYARIASRHFNTEPHEYYVTPDDVVALAPRIAEFCDQPFGNASAVPTYYCAHLAKADGVELLFGGDGGDELFGGNERYATQVIFSWYGHIPMFLRKGLIEPLLFGMPGGERIALFRKGRGYVKQASLTVPQRLHAHNMLRRVSPDSVFTHGFLDKIDPAVPLQLLQRSYDSANARGSLNRMLAMDLQFTLADNDLYKVNTMCELADIEVAYPMLNDELVAFSTRLPEHLKLRGRTLRYFFKESLTDFLPAEIMQKKKHGFGLPIGLWMQSHTPLRALVYDAVRNLGSRGVVQPAFIDGVISEHQSGHATYWGGEIWVLSQLELWLQAHGWPSGKSLL